MAKAWPAYTEWDYSNGGQNYLQDLIGNTNVATFTNTDVSEEGEYQGCSFNPSFVTQYPYKSKFLPEMSNSPTGIVMRDSTLSATLEKDIERPSFYDNIGEYVGLEFTQG